MYGGEAVGMMEIVGCKANWLVVLNLLSNNLENHIESIGYAHFFT
jgi:hypothetical protein